MWEEIFYNTMYARTHFYLTERITGSRNPLLLFGSVLPDFHQTGALPRGFDIKAVEFMKFLKARYPNLLPLAVGMTLHEFPIGPDRFLHQSYKGGCGYGYMFDDKLLEESKVVFSCDSQTASLADHFCVENAIEYKIVTENPEVEKLFRKVLRAIDREMIISALSEFYNSDRENVSREFDMFLHLNLDFDYSEYESMGAAWAEIFKRIMGRDVDAHRIAGLIRKTQQIIAPTVGEFLQYCVDECTREFDYNFGKIKKEILNR